MFPASDPNLDPDHRRKADQMRPSGQQVFRKSTPYWPRDAQVSAGGRDLSCDDDGADRRDVQSGARFCIS